MLRFRNLGKKGNVMHSAHSTATTSTTVSLFRNGSNQAIRLPRDLEFQGVNQLEAHREGDVLILRPLHPSWTSLAEVTPADEDFLAERPDVIAERDFIGDEQ
jgi:antitoxin VapB